VRSAIRRDILSRVVLLLENSGSAVSPPIIAPCSVAVIRGSVVVTAAAQVMEATVVAVQGRRIPSAVEQITQVVAAGQLTPAAVADPTVGHSAAAAGQTTAPFAHTSHPTAPALATTAAVALPRTAAALVRGCRSRPAQITTLAAITRENKAMTFSVVNITRTLCTADYNKTLASSIRSFHRDHLWSKAARSLDLAARRRFP